MVGKKQKIVQGYCFLKIRLVSLKYRLINENNYLIII